MAAQKFDGVIEAVHCAADGQVAWVRAYERRGSAFSDLVLISRSDLIARLKAGKKFVTGRRIEYMAGSFEGTQPVRLQQQTGGETLANGERTSSRDTLDGVPFV